MSETRKRLGLLSVPSVVAGGLVVAGIGLWMLVDRAWVVVAGLGVFGPGILRELGVLRDHDEFQRQAAHRAGYHAWLIGGLSAVLIAASLELRGAIEEDPSEWVFFIILILWASWMFSALLAYWGARKTTTRVLLTFGSFWALFVLVDLGSSMHVPADTRDLLMMLAGIGVGIGVVAPFFILAKTAGRWPRRTGTLLLIVSAAFLLVFGTPRGRNWVMVLMTDVLLIVPLVACGVALLYEGAADDGEIESTV